MAGVFVSVALVLILGDGNIFDVGGGVVVIDYWCLCFFGCSLYLDLFGVVDGGVHRCYCLWYAIKVITVYRYLSIINLHKHKKNSSLIILRNSLLQSYQLLPKL